MGYLIVFMDAGLSTATVQRENITQAQVSNLFWINVALSSAAALVLATSSPLVAWLYREPRLIAINLVLSSTFFLGGAPTPGHFFTEDTISRNQFRAGVTSSSLKTTISLSAHSRKALLSAQLFPGRGSLK